MREGKEAENDPVLCLLEVEIATGTALWYQGFFYHEQATSVLAACTCGITDGLQVE